MRSRLRFLSLPLALALLACDDDTGSADASMLDAPVPVFDAAAAADAPSPVDAAPPDAPPLADAGPVVLTSTTMFQSAAGQLCGVGFDHVSGEIWVYPCSGTDVLGFTAAGVSAGTLARPGESANDVDVTFAPVALVLGADAVAEGAMIFINGESGVVELYAPETAGSTPLATAFGASHVVGGGYHAARQSFFVVQDRVSGTQPSTIAELDRVTGAVLNSFSTLPAFDVNFGDLEVCQSSGHLFVVSSDESTIAEYSPTGTFLTEHPLPAGVTAVSGLAIATNGEGWVCGTGGEVWRIEGLPCNPGR